VSQTFNMVLFGSSEGLSPVLVRLLSSSSNVVKEKEVDAEWSDVDGVVVDGGGGEEGE